MSQNDTYIKIYHLKHTNKLHIKIETVKCRRISIFPILLQFQRPLKTMTPRGQVARKCYSFSSAVKNASCGSMFTKYTVDQKLDTF